MLDLAHFSSHDLCSCFKNLAFVGLLLVGILSCYESRGH